METNRNEQAVSQEMETTIRRIVRDELFQISIRSHDLQALLLGTEPAADLPADPEGPEHA